MNPNYTIKDHPIKGLNQVSQSPERQPMVPCLVKDIEESLGRLHCQISDLKNRLQPVMSGHCVGIPETRADAPPPSCELVGKLHDFNTIIRSASELLAEMRGNLEI